MSQHVPLTNNIHPTCFLCLPLCKLTEYVTVSKIIQAAWLSLQRLGLENLILQTWWIFIKIGTKFCQFVSSLFGSLEICSRTQGGYTCLDQKNIENELFLQRSKFKQNGD